MSVVVGSWENLRWLLNVSVLILHTVSSGQDVPLVEDGSCASVVDVAINFVFISKESHVRKIAQFSILASYDVIGY